MGDKKQQGQLIWKEGLGWYGRFYAMVHGERIRIARALHTDNRAVAQRKLARLIASSDPSSEEATRIETFEEAARRVVEQQKHAGMSTWKDRLARFEHYAFKTLGPLPVDTVKASHIRSVLESVRDLGKSKQTMAHVKNDVSVVLGDLWRGEVLPENVAERVKIPEAMPAAVEQSKKERAVLTDDELVVYLGWQHPDERYREAVLERQTMACVARMFGGLRTSDLHSIRWEGFDLTDNGAFAWGYAPRRKGHRLSKGGKPQRLWVPEMLRPILHDWWQRQGKPAEGLVFPKRRGAGAGEEGRARSSHALSFRSDLRRAFGMEALVPISYDRSNGRPLTTSVWQTVRELTQRERVLFEETEYSRPVDFHSWRRAFNQALADAGVNVQQAQALAGHSSMAAHERYLRNTEKARAVPAGALPRLGVGSIGHNDVGTFEDSPRILANTGTDCNQEMPSKPAENWAKVTCKASALPLSYPPGQHVSSCFEDRPPVEWALRVPKGWAGALDLTNGAASSFGFAG